MISSFKGHGLAFIALAAFGASVPAYGTVSYVCGTGVSTTACDALTTVAGIFNSTFTNATASIYVSFGTISAVAESTQFINDVTFSQYQTALAADETDANDVTAVASLGGGTTNPVVAGDGVGLTSALATALGLTTQAGSVGITTGDGSCTLGSGGCYNGLITVSNSLSFFYRNGGSITGGQYDFLTALEHETDEMLGTASCIGNTNSLPTASDCNNGLGPTPGVSPADLFRYVGSSTTRSFLGASSDQSDGTSTACFSINGGATDIACYNNTDNGADYGDWDSASGRVQNAFGSPGVSGVDITNDGGSELAVLDAVGYNLQSTTPEPGTLGLFGASIVTLAFLRRRYSRK